MKGRQWSILILLLLANYLIFSSLFMFVAESQKPPPTPTRTPMPTFTSTRTSTPMPPPPTPTPTLVLAPTATPTIPPQPTEPPPPLATSTPTARTGRVVHIVQHGEWVGLIAEKYGVPADYIRWLNNLTPGTVIHPNQELIIPAPGEVIPSPTPGGEIPPTNTPAPPPPPPQEAPTQPPAQHQFTGRVEKWWPNCGLAAVGKSKVLDAKSGEAVNGVRIRIWNDAGFEAFSLVSGVGKTYGPGEYDIVLNNHPIEAKFYIAAWDWQTGPNDYVRVDSDVLTLEFDTKNCNPDGDGHQVVIVNWYRNW
mgnify:CR=1 FL=1